MHLKKVHIQSENVKVRKLFCFTTSIFGRAVGSRPAEMNSFQTLVETGVLNGFLDKTQSVFLNRAAKG